MNRTVKKDALFICIFFFITHAYFFQGGGWNQNCRVCLVRAMLHERTFAIGSFLEPSATPGIDFANTGDWSYYKGRYYINKSPGLSMLALAPFAVGEYAARHVFPSDTARQVLAGTYVATVFTAGICGALLCAALFYMMSVLFKLPRARALLLTFFFGLGTLVLSYATTLYSHVPAAFFSFLSFVLAMHIRQGGSRHRKTAAVLSGLAASLAVLIEPSTVLMLVFVFLFLLGFGGGRTIALLFLAGCIPCGFLQCFYNAVCFGGPFQSSYAYANDAVMVRVDGSLFGVPRFATMAAMLFLPYRGLFVSSPVMLMALPGAVVLFRAKQLRPEALLCVAVSVVFFVWMAGFRAWYGGSTIGPRYLLPAFPFFFMLAVCALQCCPRIFAVLGALSILINTGITVIGNEIPCKVMNPLADVIVPNILRGAVSINPTPVSDFSAYPSLYALLDIDSWALNFNSFNLGEFLFPYSLLSLVPLVVLWVVVACIWQRCSS